MVRGAFAVIGMLMLAGAAEAPARVPPRTSLGDVEQEVMCPTCGTALMVAQSPLADRERAFIKARIARGENKGQIKRDMVAEFGPSVLATPRARGFDLSAYLVPGVALGLALAGVGLGLRGWRRRGSADDVATPGPLASALTRRLDEDLTRYDL